MAKKLLIVSLLVSLLLGLSTSSFFLDEYLTQKISFNKFSAVQLNFAIEQENVTALTYAWKNALLHSSQWQKLARTLAKTQGDAAYQLALYHQSNIEKAIFWYKTSIRKNYLKASIALAQLYFQQGNLVNAKEVLAALPKSLPEKLTVDFTLLEANIAINEGVIGTVEEIISQNTQQIKKEDSGRVFLEKLKKYQIPHFNKPLLNLNPKSMTCENSIQLFATSINHLEYLDNLIIDFKKQALNELVCFSPVRYLPKSILDCNTVEGGAISCDERNWQLLANTINTRYVGVMLPSGGANVHLGVLYFDAQDTVDVVAHEISHLLGFIDEYPLRAEHVSCQATQKEMFSQNIAVLKNSYQGEKKVIRSKVLSHLAWSKYIKSSTPILHLAKGASSNSHWELGTPEQFKHEIGLFSAKTCEDSNHKNKGDFSAFKPLFNRTKLEYSELNFPQVYSLLLKDNKAEFRMPSFHYNIALAYARRTSLEINSIKQAEFWLEKAAEWEKDLERSIKIRQGEF